MTSLRAKPLRTALTCAFSSGALAVAAVPASAAEDLPNDVAAREDAVRLQPATPWNLDYGEDRCRLTRLFGDEDDRHLIFFDQTAPQSSFGLTMAGSEVKKFREARRIHLGLERDEVMERLDEFGRGDVPQIGAAVILSSVSISDSAEEPRMASAGIDLAEAETIDRVVLKKGNSVLSFETGSLMPPLQALNTCTEDLLKDWGLDPEQHANYVPPRFQNEAVIARRIQAVYPRTALNRGEQANFKIRVIVETDGSVSDCYLQETTATRDLESPACKEMMNARFDPARDAQGQPMRSFYSTSILYRIG